MSELESLQKSTNENLKRVLESIDKLLTEKFNALETAAEMTLERLEDFTSTCTETVSVIDEILLKLNANDNLMLAKLMSKVNIQLWLLFRYCASSYLLHFLCSEICQRIEFWQQIGV